MSNFRASFLASAFPNALLTSRAWWTSGGDRSSEEGSTWHRKAQLVAEDAVGHQEYTVAEAIWAELDGRDSTWYEPVIRRADIAALRNDHAEAISRYDACLSRFPRAWRCLAGKARSHVQLEDLGTADHTYGRLIEQDKDHVVALREWSALKRKLGQDVLAAQLLSSADEAERRLAIPIGR
jgi:hypothetical protein